MGPEKSANQLTDSHHVQSVEAGERGSDLLHHHRFFWEEPLQNSRPGQDLLDLLGSSQVSADVGALDSQRAFDQEAGLPRLKGQRH